MIMLSLRPTIGRSRFSAKLQGYGASFRTAAAATLQTVDCTYSAAPAACGIFFGRRASPVAGAFGRVSFGLRATVDRSAKSFLEPVAFHRRASRGIEFCPNDIRGVPFGANSPVPTMRLEFGKACFRRRRQIRQRGQPHRSRPPPTPTSLSPIDCETTLRHRRRPRFWPPMYPVSAGAHPDIRPASHDPGRCTKPMPDQEFEEPMPADRVILPGLLLAVGN